MRGESVNLKFESLLNPHTPHVKQSTAPALYHTRSVELLTSFHEFDSEAAMNIYRGNQCSVIHQVPAQGNEERKRRDVNQKAWSGITKYEEKENERSEQRKEAKKPKGPRRRPNKQDDDIGGSDLPCHRVCKNESGSATEK
uniref:Uncharacterized protein n=1 Tax=Plectus sambesii TaxID=2011161 RepID=A0A914XJT8_9BILA